MQSKTKVGVIGVGHLGKHHVQHFSNITDVDLQGIYDINHEVSERISREHKTRSYSSLFELIERVDAVSIVTPTKDHKTIAKKCIEEGKHVFIEKPITQTVEEADELIELAKNKNIIIQVGHIERLNPALIPLKNYDINPKFVEVQRLAPYMIRGSDIPVVLDLMIHDIDIVLSLIPSPITHIESTGVSRMTQSVDIANARISFENGAIANLTSSSVAKDRVRKLKIFQQDLYITVDFLIGLTEIYKAMDGNQGQPGAIMTAPLKANGQNRQIIYEKPSIPKTDALKMELENFVKAVKGEEDPIVDGLCCADQVDLSFRYRNIPLA